MLDFVGTHFVALSGLGAGAFVLILLWASLEDGLRRRQARPEPRPEDRAEPAQAMPAAAE